MSDWLLCLVCLPGLFNTIQWKNAYIRATVVLGLNTIVQNVEITVLCFKNYLQITSTRLH